MIPNDPIILLSYINTLLRDKYSSFEELCDDMELDGGEISAKLKAAGYGYSAEKNCFKQVSV